MARRITPPSSITLSEWRRLARDKRIHLKITSDPVLQIYPALIGHFNKIKISNWNDVVVGLHIVFAWMPTMVKLQPLARMKKVQRHSIAMLLRKAKSGTLLTGAEIESLLTFSSNSSIGLSKLLHFLSPRNYAIWDTRVANAFLTSGRSYANIRKAAPFVLYINTLSNWAKRKSAQSCFKRLRTMDKRLQSVSDLRLIEIVLWHAGKKGH